MSIDIDIKIRSRCYRLYKQTSRGIIVGDKGTAGCCTGSVHTNRAMGQRVSYITRSYYKLGMWERGNVGT